MSEDAKRDMWGEHRGANQACRTCMWWVEKLPAANTPPTPDIPLGRCRHHSPTLKGWPAVYAADWCGDHKMEA